MYRPEGWKNPHTPMQDEPFTDLANAHFRNIADGKHIAYEAGADAYGEALVKQGRYITPATYIDYPPLIASIGAQGKRGHIVFIPEVKE